MSPELTRSSSENGVLSTFSEHFVQSLYRQGIDHPLKAVEQVVKHSTNIFYNKDSTLSNNSSAKIALDEADSAIQSNKDSANPRFLSTAWWGDMVGGTAATVGHMWLLHKAGFVGTGAVLKNINASLSDLRFGAIKNSAYTGAFMGGILTPSKDTDSLSEFVQARVINAGISATSFSLMTGLAFGFKSMGLNSDLLANSISSGMGGLFDVNVRHVAENGKLEFASLEENIQAGVGFAVGAGLAHGMNKTLFTKEQNSRAIVAEQKPVFSEMRFADQSSAIAIFDRPPSLWRPKARFNNFNEGEVKDSLARIWTNETLSNGLYSPMAQPKLVDQFVLASMKMAENWQDLRPRAQQLADLAATRDKAVQEYGQKLYAYAEHDKSPSPQNETYVFSTVSNEQRKLKTKQESGVLKQEHYNELSALLERIGTLRDSWAEQNGAFRKEIDTRKTQVEILLSSFSHETRPYNLPSTKFALLENTGEFRARYGDATSFMAEDVLFSNSNMAGFVRSKIHEMTHREQEASALRLKVDELDPRGQIHKIDPTDKVDAVKVQIIQDWYTDKTGGLRVSVANIQDVVEARAGKILSQAENLRAKQILESFKTRKDPGVEYVESGNSFKVIENEYLKLQANKINGARLFLARVDQEQRSSSSSLGGTHQLEQSGITERFFSSNKLPSTISALVTEMGSIRNSIDGHIFEIKAQSILLPYFRARMLDLNAKRQDLANESSVYALSKHEQEAALVAQFAWLRAKAKGASSESLIQESAANFSMTPRTEKKDAKDPYFSELKDDSHVISKARSPLGEKFIENFFEEQTKIALLNRRYALAADRDKIGWTGESVQPYLFDIVQTKLVELQAKSAVSSDWKLGQTMPQSAADKVGGDFFLINRATGELILLDVTLNNHKNNLPQLRSDWVIWLKDRAAIEKTSGNLDLSSNAGRLFSRELESQLVSITNPRQSKFKDGTVSPLNIYDGLIPPSPLKSLSPVALQAEIARFRSDLVTEAQKHTPGSLKAALLLDYAKSLSGSEKYVAKEALKQPSPPSFVKLALEQSESIFARIAWNTAINRKSTVASLSGSNNSDIVLTKDGHLLWEMSDRNVTFESQHTASAYLESARSSLLKKVQTALSYPKIALKDHKDADRLPRELIKELETIEKTGAQNRIKALKTLSDWLISPSARRLTAPTSTYGQLVGSKFFQEAESSKLSFEIKEPRDLQIVLLGRLRSRKPEQILLDENK